MPFYDYNDFLRVGVLATAYPSQCVRVLGASGVLYYSIHYHYSSGHSFNHEHNAFLLSTSHRSYNILIYSLPRDRCTRMESSDP